MDARKFPPRPSLEQYRKQAKDLVKAWKAGAPEAKRRVQHHHPRFRLLADAALGRARFALADAQVTIAREYGFASWPMFVQHVTALAHARSSVAQFESAVDAVISGDVATLARLLGERPHLTRERSTRAHRATLLHYLAANGVEDYRQQSPPNAPSVAQTLLDAGADVDAPATAYGTRWATTLELVVSSVHPAKAGVQVALVETLLDAGAHVNGVADDGSPLLTALAFHYPEAAAALARRGARVDTIIAAAGLGRDDLVRRFLSHDGRLRAGVPLAGVRWLRLPKDPKAHVELALVWAAMLGRSAVVALFLERGVDPGATDARRFSALHWAAYYGYPETVERLLEWHAPLEARNVYGGTVLDQVVWATQHEGVRPHHVAILERLIAAGARVDPGWLRAEHHPPLDERVANVLRRSVQA